METEEIAKALREIRLIDLMLSIREMEPDDKLAHVRSTTFRVIDDSVNRYWAFSEIQLRILKCKISHKIEHFTNQIDISQIL